MKKTNQFKFLALLAVLAYVLSACTGVAPAANANQGQDDQPQQVVFTGTVEAMGGTWTISGQAVSVTGTTRVDATVTVGSNVRVEAVVDQNGVVTAISIETAGADDPNANGNANDANANDVNGNDANGNTNDNTNANTNGDDNSNANGNTNGNANGNSNDGALTGTEKEITGKVDAITSTSITIDGVAYDLSSKTEIKDAIAVGDTVKAHVVTSADGKQTIREIEKISGTGLSGNTNGNDNDNDDHGGNSNGSDDNGNSNGNDDHGGNSNSSGGDNQNSNSSNTNGDDHGGNSNDNGGGGNDNGGNGNGNGNG